ncbi:MAG: tetratricopeptide repeat protein [Candidatus Acidiferrum sp.]
MASSLTPALQFGYFQTHHRAEGLPRLSIARVLLPFLFFALFAPLALSQGSGSDATDFNGAGAEVTVTVHDPSGQPISTPAIVKLYLDGSILSRQGQTSGGASILVVNKLGGYSLVVEAAGYQRLQKDLSLDFAGRTQVDVYLRPMSTANAVVGVPGPPILAPKAQKAMAKALDEIKSRKFDDAEKNISEAMRLAPSHPDVLYVRGVLYLEERNWVPAQTALEKATQIDPHHARAFAALGMALFDQGKYDAAIAPLEKSLQLNPAADWETSWALAKAYYRQAQYGDALKMSQKALDDSQGKSPEISLLVAQSLTAVGRYEDAAKLLREFVKDHAHQPEAATARRWLDGLAANGKIRASSN